MFQFFHYFVNITIASMVEWTIYIAQGFVLALEVNCVDEPTKWAYLKATIFCFIFITISWASHKFFKCFSIRKN